MNRQFYNEDFEKALRDNANQYRMYPSEKVWKGIHSAMHPDRRWYGPAAFGVLLLTGIIISVLVFNIRPENSTTIEKQNPSLPVNSKTKSTFSFGGYGNVLTLKTKETHLLLMPSRKISNYSSFIDFNFKSQQNELPPAQNTGNNKVPASVKEVETFVQEPIIPENTTNDEIQTLTLIGGVRNEVNSEFISVEKSNERRVAIQSSLDDDTEKKLNESLLALASHNVPITVHKKQPKFWTQYFIAPTFSYRKLSGNKHPTTSSVFSYSRAVDVNEAVTHKPEMGFEFGMEGMYQVSNRFSLKSGLQFNINRYDIGAYFHPTEVATVAVRNGYSTYSLTRLTNYGNFSGYAQNWLQNSYFQVTIPVGADIVLADNNTVSWRIGGSIQPTYVIGETAYLLSNDFKNYAEFPDLMRRWNVSTGFGTSIGYSSGKVDWQMGPQARYQLLSSYVGGYPVKENLFSIGFKVAASFNKSK